MFIKKKKTYDNGRFTLENITARNIAPIHKDTIIKTPEPTP